MNLAFPIASVKADKSGIYGLLNKSNGKIYIGSAIKMANRWRQHRHDLQRGKHRNSYLQNAFNQAAEAFEFFIIEKIEKLSDLISREQFWINFYKAFVPDFGYNIAITAGSSLGLKRSDDFKLRKSAHHSGKPQPWLRKKIIQMDLSGKTVRIFDSLFDASRAFGFSLPNGNISSAATGAQKTAYGFKWRYA